MERATLSVLLDSSPFIIFRAQNDSHGLVLLFIVILGLAVGKNRGSHIICDFAEILGSSYRLPENDNRFSKINKIAKLSR
jgi:hypothetical protein